MERKDAPLVKRLEEDLKRLKNLKFDVDGQTVLKKDEIGKLIEDLESVLEHDDVLEAMDTARRTTKEILGDAKKAINETIDVIAKTLKI